MKRHTLQYILIIAGLIGLTLCSVCLGLQMHRNAKSDKLLKADYFAVNQIKYGLLSGSNWSWQVNRILCAKIDSFSLERDNKKILESQVSDILNRMLDEANAVLHKERAKFKD